MAISRYSNTSRINLGNQLGTPEDVLSLRVKNNNGTIPIIRKITLTSSDRLDTLSGDIYGDSKYWWVLAAASGIGWGMQVPSGTIINIIRLSDIQNLMG